MFYFGYKSEEVWNFIEFYGLVVRVVGVLVDDVDEVYCVSVENGVVFMLEFYVLSDDVKGGKMVMVEV